MIRTLSGPAPKYDNEDNAKKGGSLNCNEGKFWGFPVASCRRREMNEAMPRGGDLALKNLLVCSPCKTRYFFAEQLWTRVLQRRWSIVAA